MSKFLTASDLTSFARNGYLCPLPGLSEGEAAATLAALEEFEHRHGGFGKLLRFKAHLRLAALMAVARHERILDAVEDLIGPDILLFTSTLWPKLRPTFTGLGVSIRQQSSDSRCAVRFSPMQAA